jgi:hypothetical protein
MVVKIHLMNGSSAVETAVCAAMADVAGEVVVTTNDGRTFRAWDLERVSHSEFMALSWKRIA